MPTPLWMIPAGENGSLLDAFMAGYVAVRYVEIGDLSTCTTREELHQEFVRCFPLEKSAAIPNKVGILDKFRFVIQIGDAVVTYSPDRREYVLGVVTGAYEYRPELVPDAPHVRSVSWSENRISRDSLSPESRNRLVPTHPLFRIDDELAAELRRLDSRTDTSVVPISPQEERDELAQIKEDTIGKSHELIKDKIRSLSPDDLEMLVASVLRAMGYRARVTPKGPDRGVDVFASPDGLGLEEPRIKAEVKHRGLPMGSQDIRSFLGGLRNGDRGLYVSTGGFTKDAKYEADRSVIPVSLLTLDELATLVVTHYDSFDVEGRVLLPLTRIYWPVE